MSTEAPIDRRSAIKVRHRGAILAAARELVSERGGPRFDFADVAERAAVSRRTVFNHFASMDELCLALCGHALEVLVDEFMGEVSATPVGDGKRSSMFEKLVSTLRSTDLPQAIATIIVVLGNPSQDDRARALGTEAFNRVGDRLVEEAQRLDTGDDRLEVQLLVGSLINGVGIIAEHWIQLTEGRLDEDSRAQWQRLLTRVIESVRSGYMTGG